MSLQKKIMSRQKMKESRDKPIQVCCNKDFYVETNSSASDKNQRRNSVATKGNSVMTKLFSNHIKNVAT